ncbi:hypothetical protein PF005_g20944 [Phytophthora fragariae]|uniref:EGF-like domain-containing protein n=1 Tax=Phytophthora fragariae TaxID=53985 RepID=A0A6A3ISE1_9STRA|nr:hypothetical protein PF009_g21926 [Phytophthora fragariae]KAE8984702.1 hypothetical protein PF011_g20676 [Phytophthora fragariae]KAE9083349.1 hypothetical protein PF010_g21246 [Phytophthora fragariae]KAE9085843.1 hypothetical protein PF007_g20994 [Phytophthora fragariae]KAE9108005.1 hypothetical protein PF006_g20972 [Phytophthora fragariae]
MSSTLRTLVALLLVSLAILSPIAAQEECSGHGTMHGNHCHCEAGYGSEGVECVATGAAVSCPAGGISWELSMAMALENGTYTISFAR